LYRRYRKNVKHIVLVQPSAMARFLVSLAKGKGEAKIKRVSSLEEVTHATEGEVTLHSLGFLFLRSVGV
jgi:syndecan 1/collagen type V/XI/XXIV/XXVII alpha